MKWIIGTSVLALGLLFPLQAFAWEPPEDEATVYEHTFARCAFRYAHSALSDAQVDCLCDALAHHAVRWMDHAPSSIPALPEKTESRCLRLLD